MSLPRFDHLFQISPIPSVVLLPNAEFTIVAANKILLELFNSSEEETVGKGVFEAIAESFPNSQEGQALHNITILKKSLEQVIETKEPHKIPHQKHLLSIPGSSEFVTKYIDVLSIPVLDDQNMVTHILHSVDDVTERRILEKVSENQKQRFLDLYEESPCAMAVLKGPHHIYEMVNPLLLQLVGKDNIIGKSIKEVFPKLEEQGYFDSLDETYETGQTYTANEALVTLDINENEKPINKYLNFTYQPYRNEKGEVNGILVFAVDVTEQVTSRKRTEESEKRYWELMQNLPVATYSCDLDGRILFYNKAATALWGTAPKIGEKLWCGSWKMYDLKGDFLSENLCPMALSLKESRTMSGEELVMERPNGSKRHVLTYPVPFKGSSGQVTGGVNMLVDITDTKTAQQALEKSEKKYRQIVETAQEGILVLDTEYNFIFVNNKMCDILDYSQEEIIGKNIFSFMDEEGKKQAEKLSSKQKERLDQIEFKYTTKTGKVIWTRFSSNPLFDENGVFKGKLAMVTDITENKKAEEKLRQNEKRLKESQEIAHLGSWDFDIASQEARFSDELCRIYGLSPEENIQNFSDWLSFIHPEDLEGLQAEIKIAEETLEERSYNHRIILKNGSVRYIFGKAKYVLDDKGEPKGIYGIAHDVTEAKKAEEKLVQSEKKLKEAQEIALLGSWSLDIATEKVTFSDELCRVYGLEPEDNSHTISEWLSFVHPEDLKEVTENWEEHKNGAIHTHRIITKDGSVKYIQGKFRPELDKQGERKEIVGIVQDVTESKRGEEKLKQSEIRLKEAQKIAQFGSWKFDFATQEQIFSEEACRIYGLPVDQNKHSTEFWLSFIHPEDLDEVKSIMKKSEITLEESVYNHRIILKDGTIKHLFAKVKFEFDEKGKPKGVFGIVQDVSESKKAEERLKQSEIKLKEAQEIANLGSWEVDFATGVSLWSDETCRIYGVPLEENDKQSFEDWLTFIHPEDKEAVLANLEEAQRALTDSEINNRIILRDGTVKHTYSKYRFERNHEGKPIAMVGAVQDVTQMKTAERNLEQQNKELLKANKELDRFVYSASHDLRSPLASILGLISFIEEDSEETETLEHVKMIKTSVNRLDAFIRNILSYSQNNRTDLEVEKIPVKQKIEEVVDSLRTMNRAKGINFDISITEEQPFYSDTRRFNAILENLISNAVKYHTQDTSGRYINVAATSDKEYLRLVIADNGIGISPEHQQKIFDMFFRISGKSNGSGIGLYIVKETIEKLKGSIDVESKEGVGTVFTVTLKNLKDGREKAA